MSESDEDKEEEKAEEELDDEDDQDDEDEDEGEDDDEDEDEEQPADPLGGVENEDFCFIRDLVSRSDLNGFACKVLMHTSGGRWRVIVYPTTEVVNVETANLEKSSLHGIMSKGLCKQVDVNDVTMTIQCSAQGNRGPLVKVLYPDKKMFGMVKVKNELALDAFETCVQILDEMATNTCGFSQYAFYARREELVGE